MLQAAFTIGGETYDINIATYDHAGDTAAAVQGMKKLTLEDDAKMVMMLGGAAVGAILPWATRKKVALHDIVAKRHHTGFKLPCCDL